MSKNSNQKKVIALGNFDGLHIGHKTVIENAVKQAKSLQAEACVMLFDKHSSSVLNNIGPLKIMTKEDQTEKISQMGADVLNIKFEDIRDFSCEKFVKSVLKDEFSACAVCCGFNYRFGKNAFGDVELLKLLCAKENIDVFVSDEVDYKSSPVSSSRIRKALTQGNIRAAEAMLGESFSYNFEVVGGAKLGRTLGSPTINQIFPDDFVVPLYGVYDSRTYIDGKEYYSVTNIGVRPTVDGTLERSETYIIDYSGNLYGKHIKVSLKKYIRSEKKFSDIDELKNQIHFDAQAVRGENKMKKLNVKAVFFDFDDTLQSRSGAYRLYCQAFLSKYFPSIDESERLGKLDEMEEHVDGGYKDREDYFPELIELWNWENHPPMQELYDSFNNDYGKYVVMLPNAVDVIKELKNRGFILGIISNGVSVLQNTKLDTAGIRDLFDVVVVSGDFGVYKPDRSIFDEACRQSGIPNEECLFVGDHPINDIQGAVRADMKVVRMNQGDFYNQQIDSRIPTIEELTELLEML